jgi:hypothetical protein
MKEMKLFYGILIGFIIFLSCSNEDDSNTELSSPSVIGIWKQIRQVNSCSTGSQEIINLNTCEQTGRITISANGNYNRTSYYLDGNDCNLEGNANGTWEINNEVFSINNSNESFDYTIVELTENSLKIREDEDGQDEQCNDGFLTNYTLEYVRVEQ